MDFYSILARVIRNVLAACYMGGNLAKSNVLKELIIWGKEIVQYTHIASYKKERRVWQML